MNKPTVEKGVSNIVGVFTDPIIVFPGGWGHTLPEWLKNAITLERLIDTFIGSRVYLPYLVIVNKTDLEIPKNLAPYLSSGIEPILISAQNDSELTEIKEKIWQLLSFIRVYLKKEEKIDFQSPLIVKKGQNLKQILEKLNICNKESFKSAKIFGPTAKFPGQEVSLDFIPTDETVVQFV